MTAPPTIASLLTSKKVLITVGAGGVGKTTTAAALSVAAARQGKRVLCLTIDPAKRLAESLGIVAMTAEASTIEPARLERVGVFAPGSLTAMMLDTKRTFDELVLKYSSSEEKAQQLLTNRLYQYVSSSLAGTQEYMAMEKLISVKDDPRYDLIVLDTPPTANALDFLDAPERMMDALDSSAMKWFLDAFQSTGKFSLNLLARSAAAVLKGIGRITGGGLLDSMAEFIRALNDLFGGFKERAKLLQEVLRGSDVAFILVTSPAPMSIQEVIYFSDRLTSSGMPRGGFVVNRFRSMDGSDAVVSECDVAAAMTTHGLELGAGGAARLVQAYEDAAKLAKLDAMYVHLLDDRAAGAVPIVKIPELSSDIRDLTRLAEMADQLMAGGV